MASATRLLFEAPEPPRWSDLPWGLIPDPAVVLLHRLASSMTWLALGAVWGSAVALGWRIWNAEHEQSDPLAFDAAMLMIAATAVAFERDFMAVAPSAMRFYGGTPGQWIPAALDAGVILGSVLVASAAWRLLRRLTGEAGSLLASLAVTAYLPWTLLRQAGGDLGEKALSVFPGASALSLGLASAVCCALFFSVFRLTATAAPSIAPRYAWIRAAVAARKGWILSATSFVVLGVGLAAGPLGSTGAPPPSSAANVVLVVVDTLRADHLGAYGYPRPTSPRFDAWAREGVVFRHAYSVSSFTSPGTAGIMTSRYPSELGIESNNSYLRGAATLGEILSARGYRTAAFISNFILRRPLGFQRGFHVYDDWFPSEEAARDVAERVAHQVTDAAIEWLDHRDPARPFFLWVHYQDPHGPYLPPDEVSRPFRASDYERVRFVPASRIPRYQIVDERTDARELVASYDNEIAYWDTHFARLIERIERAGSPRGTFVVFTADHGETLDESPEAPFSHGTHLTEEQVRVPLVFAGPGIAGGRVIEGPVSSLDVLPTLMGLIGGDGGPDSRFRGVDLTAILTGGASSDRSRIIISELPSPSGDFRIAARSSNGFAEVQLAAGEDASELPRSTPEALRRALLEHRSFVERERTDARNIELLPSDVERLRALGYVE